MESKTPESTKIIFKEHPKEDGSFLAEVQLNRPQALNSLDLEMILAIKDQLNVWKDNPRLSAVFLHGQGDKAFCAGGDVKGLYSSILNARKEDKDPAQAVQPFFENEYRLDYLIHTYPHPILIWGHGFIMGGGVGLFIGGSHRVMTETSSLSMPEVSIGLFPDVGTSYMLSRLPKKMGWYLAFTGCKLNAQEAQSLDIANFYFENAQKDQVFQALMSSPFKGPEEMSSILKNLQKEHPTSSSWLDTHKEHIAVLFKSTHLKDIYKEFSNSPLEEDKRWEKNRQTFLKGSPTSAGIICEHLKRAESCELKNVFQTDFLLATSCAREKDFAEGVRALLVEKTGAPTWSPSSIEDIEDSQIQKYFNLSSSWPSHPLENL